MSLLGGSAASGQTDTAVAGLVTTTNGEPVSQVAVDLFREAPDGSRGDYLQSAVTGTDGRFRFAGLDPDRYVITFIAADGEEFTNGSRWLNVAVSAADGQTVRADAQIDDGDPGPASIGGTVTNTGGAPVRSLAVDLFQASADGSRGVYQASTTTAADGTYRFPGLAPGPYVLTFIAAAGDEFTNGSRWLNLPVVVAAGETVTDADAVLLVDGAPDPASIGGTVTTTGGDPVESVAIDLFSATADGSRDVYLDSATTAADGTYGFSDLIPGSYIVTFVGAEGQEFANGSRWLNVAVTVPAGEAVVDVDAQLVDDGEPPQGRITGQVTNVSGAPVPLRVIDLFAAQADGARGEFVAGRATDNNGEFSFDVPAGTYVVTFVAGEAEEFVGGGRFRNTAVSVRAGETVGGVDAVLRRTVDGLRALWASERADIVAAIVDGGYGLDANGILTGPGGFTFDTTTCPAGWSNTEGVENGEIKIAMTSPLSGNLATYSNLSIGSELYFNWLNDNGGIGPDGLRIRTIIRDDAYVPDLTVERVADLLQFDQPFLIQTLGTPGTFAVQDTLNDVCVPQPMVWTSHSAWGDPANHPWTTGMELSYATEALLWGAWIEQNFAEPVTVGALVMDNQLGLAYRQSFADYVTNNPDVISDVTFVPHDPAAGSVANEIEAIAALGPDVYISMTAGNPCLLAMQEAQRSGLAVTADALFTSSLCQSVPAYMAPVGDAADGWYTNGGGLKDTTDPRWENDVWVSFANQELTARGGDPEIAFLGRGFAERGWAFEQVLHIAAALPDGLTRTNLVLAQRALSEMTHPMLLDGIGFGMSGNEDAYFIEGSDINVFDAETQRWNNETIIDLSGQTPNCSWVPGQGC